MSLLRPVAALVRSFLIEGRRSKAALFWNLAFPMVFLVGLLLVFGGGEPRQELQVLPGVLTINLIAAAFFGISLYMVSLREQGLYRRLRVTPISALAVVTAHALASLVLLAVSVALQLVVVKVFFGLELAGSPAQVLLAFLVSAFGFIPLGLMVGSVAGSMKTAPALSNLLFFPMVFLSGSAMPLFLMPAWIQRAAELLPATYAGEALRAALATGDFQLLSLPTGVLLLTGVVAFTFDVLVFRWEAREPIRRRALAVGLALLAAIYLALFLVGVELKSRQPPEGATGSSRSGAAAVTTGATEEEEAAGPRIFQGMTLLDGIGNRVENAWMRVEAGRISELGSGDPPTAEGVPAVDLSGTFVIPGLIDSHVHIGASAGGSASSGEYMPSRLLRDLQVYLALGVTSVVSMTDIPDDLRSLRAAVEAGTMRAPRPFYTGPGLTAPNGHPARFFTFVPGLAATMTRQVESPEEAEAAVRELAGKVDLVKLYLESGWVDESFPVLSEAALRAAVDTAHELGMTVAVHVDNDRHARLALDAGAESIEHVPPDLSSETIQAMVAQKAWLVPTLVSFEGLAKVFGDQPLDDPLVERWVDPNILDSLTSPDSWISRVKKTESGTAYYTQRYDGAREALKRAIAAEVPIVAGTDAGNPASFHGLALLRELELLVELGMPPGDALVAATGNAARRLGTSEVGRIAPRARADFVVLGSDPSQDISALEDIRDVYFRGKALDRDQLLSSSPGPWMPGAPQ